MRVLIPVVFFILAVGILHSSSSARAQTSTVVEQLTQLEQQLARALVERDLKAYASLLAPDWTTIDLSGRVLTKSQVVEELSSKERPIEAAVIDELKVRELGEMAAVVTGRTKATGSYKGQRITVVLRFTDVMVKRDGRWQVVASQGTQILE
jgi:uncharacterized protein (TIGR02246 family)